MSNGAARTSAGATYRMLRELGSRAQHSYAAIREPSDLVVVQRFVRATATEGAGATSGDATDATPLDAEAMALLLRDARCLAKSWHPNVARVRHVDLAPGPRPLGPAVLTIASELVEGATLEDLIEAAQPERTSARDPLLALPILTRILLDVLGGLHALHGLRDGMNAPLGAIHGELCPANVVVGKDGVARIVNVLRRRPVRIGYGSEAVAHAAPEALDAGGTDDPRSDVYAVGVMLWEGLAGRRLYTETVPGEILVRQREGELPAPAIQLDEGASPFARLADVAARALSFDPSLRYRNVTEMAADLRKIAGARLATGASVAAWVADLAGDRIRMRRAVLEPALSGTRRRVRASERPVPVVPAEVDRAIESAQVLIVAALATTTAQMRAVAAERAVSSPVLPEAATPDDLDIPIDVTETWNEPAPQTRRRFVGRGVVGLVGLAAVALVAVSALVAMRARAVSGGAVAVSSPAVVAAETSAQAQGSAALAATMSAPVAASAPTVRARAARAAGPTARAAGPTAPPPPSPPSPSPPPKPKRSLYDPDGL